MKYILFMLLVLCLSCKKRKINVEGIVTDIYTNKPVEGAKVKFYSLIEQSAGGGSSNTYETVTDNTGHFYFKNAVFYKSGNSGNVELKDTRYMEIINGETSIKKDDLKFVGKTRLTRNLQVMCFSTLNVNLNISPSVDFSNATFYLKFYGSAPLPYFSEFTEMGRWHKVQKEYDRLPSQLVGYSDGINIIKTDYFDNASNSLKTHYDTIISAGCGSVNSYTINLN